MSLEDFRGKSSVVLYFYPEGRHARLHHRVLRVPRPVPRLPGGGSAILGISPDDQASHVKFAEKYALPFPCSPTRTTRSPRLTASGRKRTTTARNTWASSAPHS